MSKDFSSLLPDPTEGENIKISPEKVLTKLASSFNDRYNGRIFALVVSSGKVINEKTETLSFTLYLQFLRHNDFSYPLLVAECFKNSGTYPIKLVSHYGPPTDYGEINTEEEFEDALEKILKEERTRHIILSMY
jgi:hypothetical protein